MSSNIGTRNVGGIDPTRKTSPIVEEMSEDSYTLRQEVPSGGVCYFNDDVFDTGEFVRSGTVILECREGLWVEVGPADPDNP
jgi:hypothetical protein